MKKLGVAFATLVLGMAGPAVMVDSAHAQTLLKICNSTNSRGPIKVFSSNWPAGRTVITGECNSFGDIPSIEVDPDPELGGDVGSTWWGLEGEGLDHCVPGEPRIDPPNDTNGKYVKYNTDASGC